MVGPLAEIHDATTASGRAALFGFSGLGPEQRRAIGEAALARAALQQLARIFGPEAEHPRATLYKDWATDPLTATPADWTSAGHPHGDLSRIEGPWARRLVLAGSEASPTEAGFLAGAIEASRRAAAEIAARLAATAGR
jgi:monoamine oxidase